MRKFSAFFLLLLIISSVAVMWERAKWATSIPETGSFFLASCWVVLFLIGRARPRLHRLLIPLCGVVLWGLIQSLMGITVYQWPTTMAILYWAGNLAAFFCGLQTFADRDIRILFLNTLVFFTF